MKLNISEILKFPGAREEFQFLLTDIPETADVSLIGPVAVKGQAVNTGVHLEVAAQVEAKILSTCGRCLDELITPVDFTFVEQYHRERNGDDPEEDSENSVVISYEGEWLDLSQAVLENLLLNIPMRVVCQPECPGICPCCGRNLKEGPCQCTQKDIDPRLAVLAKLKTNRE